MAYADYATYLGRGGQASSEDFARQVTRASEYIDRVTFGRAATYDDTELRLAAACCELVDAALTDEKGGEISQETIDGYSVIYTKGISNTLSYQQKQQSIVRLHLGDTGLLYRGVHG